MTAENFFSRWSRRKTEVTQGNPVPAEPAEQPAPPAAPPAHASALPAQPEAASPPAPTMEDVARLTPDSDFTPFVARGVEENVRRSAMKKLFSDPHFNVMDGLDVYIDDYNKFEPIPPAMLAALNHAKDLLDPASRLEKPLMQLIDTPAAQDQEDQAAPAEPQDGAGEEDSTEEASAAPEHDDAATPDSPVATNPEKPANDDPIQSL